MESEKENKSLVKQKNILDIYFFKVSKSFLKLRFLKYPTWKQKKFILI